MMILDVNNIDKQSHGLAAIDLLVKHSRGFTIVELLVVIVVIGVLAAITVTSYTGISSRANTTADKHNADSVRRAAQMVYTNTGVFPLTSGTSATVITNLNATETKVPTSLTVNNVQQLTASATIQYLVNVAGTGICVGYWDYSGSGSVAYIYSGTAATGTNGATPSCV